MKQQNVYIQDDNDIKKIVDLFLKNYKVFIVSVVMALFFAFLINKWSVPVYKVSSSLLIKEDNKAGAPANMNDFMNSGLFKMNQNFQNELWVLKSSPVIARMIENVNLPITYYKKKGTKYIEIYNNVPFKVSILRNHIQPVHVRFKISILDSSRFQITAKAKNVVFQYIEDIETLYTEKKWKYVQEGEFGKLLETDDLAFVLHLDTIKNFKDLTSSDYCFEFSSIPVLAEVYKNQLEFNVVQKDATVVEISLKGTVVQKGKDILNQLMDVYSQQNLAQKNHIANITIDYIEKQLGEISDSLAQTEDNLQSFRSSRQLLNITEQATGIATQYRDLQNQMAELTTRKRYYDYVSDYLASHDDFSEMIVPASMGIQDQLLNNLMTELISAQAQRSNLIQNNQEKNPVVQRLTIQIDNIRGTIAENISAVRKTTEISIDEMNKRIRRIEAEMSRLPQTQRQLGGIERKYRLNDAIYNYLLEKRAEAKITQASNLPDVSIIEPAKMVGSEPVSPNRILNYLLAFVLGLTIPFGLLMGKGAISNTIESQEEFERLSGIPVLGKIMHNHRKTNNVVFEHPKSNIAESFRALRTNIEYQFKGKPHKVIFVSSSIEGEGKSFVALNLAMSYALLNRKTILVDIDLRKPAGFFTKEEVSLAGLSSYYSDLANLDEVILQSPHDKLDFIPSGPIPPNPMELLTLDKTKELIVSLCERYDCVILDTTPLAQVSDAYLLMEYADVKLVVARYNYSLKKVFSLVIKDLNHKNVENVYLVLNDNKYYRDQYGYGYGYENKRK